MSTLQVREGETLVFVYGSLMLGEENHDALVGSRGLGPARTEPGYTLWDLGEYPGMSEAGAGAVVGELYAVDEATLAALDRFEEVPDAYRRVEVRLAGGAVAQGYVLSSADGGERREIASGEWRTHRRARNPSG